ncbi:MAG: Na+/H+ antiporter NhaA [Sphingobacteriales bacterium]|nr:MAG: Na+/H+ antiporter NhaA [Sphingobacteriales bacterium]TAF83378.1 MAG: Na+/H+ antiporter NhaA [Sphingobacteriales bacterium]
MIKTIKKHKVTKLFNDFFESEKAGGLILIFCTAVSLLLANSVLGPKYQQLWAMPMLGHSLVHWINDGLMTIFFLLIGLELEREVYQGELSNIKDALLPLFAALGGVLLPAGIYLLFNWGSIYQSGAGIPMATDIAFALGILSLLGNKVPLSLKLFLTALAVIDDLLAIVVIAIFYTHTIHWVYLCSAISVFCVLLALNRLKIRNLIPYILGGLAMWYFMLHSGVHATITGVLLAFAIPFGNGDTKSSSFVLQNFLHKPVAYLILPLFALANTAIILKSDLSTIFDQKYSLGIALGLIIGKPLGIFLFSFTVVSLGFCKLASNLRWKHIAGIGFLGGIGFTMSIFITLLSFHDSLVINNAKFVILSASVVAGMLGYVGLYIGLKNKQ